MSRWLLLAMVSCLGCGGGGAPADKPAGDAGIDPTDPDSGIVERLGCVDQVSAGSRFACALTDAGAVWCWGEGELGQLGHGTFDSSATPVQVIDQATGQALQDIVELTSGCQHSCARTAGGELFCWGRNASGNLGNPAVADSAGAVPVLTSAAGDRFRGATQVVAGCSQTCAVQDNGAVSCWGLNNTGQLGDGTTFQRDLPVPVMQSIGGAGLEANAAAPGSFHGCAVRGAGEILCWGRNDYGLLGDGTGQDSFTTVSPSTESGPLMDVSSVTLGFTHSCAVRADGSVWCWGLADNGIDGFESFVDSLEPVQLGAPIDQEEFSGVEHLASGNNALHGCALKADTSLWCWGKNHTGQLGDGTTSYQKLPVEAQHAPGEPMRGVRQAAVTQLNTCALKIDGSLWCWGDNAASQLGEGQNPSSMVPIEVTLDCPAPPGPN